jgi:hypothetical protein
MKFVVYRTSSRSEKSPPLPECQKELVIRRDTRTASRPEDIPAHRGQPSDWWYKNGKNHRVEDGCIVRDFDDEVWVLEVRSLEDLVAISKRESGSLIIGGGSQHRKLGQIEDLPSLEIYDAYRE